jgi:3-isopropylmalate dehydrogenase
LTNKEPEQIDFSIIRENTEDFYVGLGGKAKNGKNKHQLNLEKNLYKIKFGVDVDTKGSEIAYQIGLLSKKGCERIMKFAFDYAQSKNKTKVTAVDKANSMDFYSLWRETADKVSKNYNEIEHEFSFVDSVAMHLLRAPERYEVVVAPNMFGDIMTDLGIVIQGGLGLSAGANINPKGISMFQPVHGSAPKFKGQNIVNPIAAIRAGAMMLENLGEQKSSDLILKAIESVLKDGRTRTTDLGGHNSTSEMGDAIKDKFVELHD